MTGAEVRHRRAARAVALLLATLLATGLLSGIGLLTAGSGTAATTAAPATKRVQLALTAVGPAALKVGDELLITGSVGNGTRKRYPKARVSVTLHAGRLVGRTAVQDWTSGTTDSSADRRIGTDVAVRGLVARGSARFSLRIPVTGLGLYSWSSSGPRGITVEVTNGTRTLARQRTTIVWWPQDSSTPTGLTLLAPLVATEPSTDAGAPTVAIEKDLAGNGRLDRVLDATQSSAFAYAVDPAVLASATALKSGAGLVSAAPSASSSGTSSTASGTASSPGSTPSAAQQQDAAAQSGRDWLAKFGQRTAGRTVLGLPFGDPDLNSVLNNKASSLLKMTGDLGRRVSQQTVGQQFETRIAWPGDGRLPTRSVSALAKNGYDAVLLASATQPVEDAPVGATQTGRSTLTGGGGRTLDGLLYDEDLSTLVSSGGGARSVLATQTLLAELAAITAGYPNDPRHLLAVTPRTWSPNPASVQALTGALESVPFVRLDTVPELRAQEPVPGRAEPVYGAAAKAAELPPSAVNRALALKRKLDVFGPAVSRPDAVLDPYRERVSSLLTVAWRRDRDDLSVAGTEIDRRVGELVDGVHLQVGSEDKLFTARSAPIQLAVNNETPNDLRVRIVLKPRVLKPDSGELKMDSKEIVAKANQQTKVLIPTQASGSGDVVVTATLQNLNGGTIEEPSQFSVKVRPDWETRGMIGAASLLGLLLVIGLLRGVRRNRTRVPSADVPDVDDLAVQKAEATGSIPIRVPPPDAGPKSESPPVPGPLDTVARVEVGAKARDDA